MQSLNRKQKHCENLISLRSLYTTVDKPVARVFILTVDNGTLYGYTRVLMGRVTCLACCPKRLKICVIQGILLLINFPSNYIRMFFE